MGSPLPPQIFVIFSTSNFSSHTLLVYIMFHKMWDRNSRGRITPATVDQDDLSLLSTGFSNNLWADSPTHWRQPTWQTKEFPNILGRGALHRAAAWIRDELDPVIAQEGPKSLLQDDVVSIHTLLIAIQQHDVSLSTLKVSRIHLAIMDICGKATRWPTKLAIQADHAVTHLESLFGPLKQIRLPLFEPGGRLSGVCLPADITKEVRKLSLSHLLPNFLDGNQRHLPFTL
jgi:hypothetical protein